LKGCGVEKYRFPSCDPQVLTFGYTETRANSPKSDQSLGASNSAVPPCQIGIIPHKPFFHWVCRENAPGHSGNTCITSPPAHYCRHLQL